MAIPYENYESQIEAADDVHSSSDSEDGHQENTAPKRTRPLTKQERQEILLQNRWPKGLGLWLCTTGFISATLGMIQVLLIPLAQDDHVWPSHLSKRNIYGIGIWAGTLLIFIGALGIRSALYKSVTMVYTFFGLILLSILVFIVLALLVLVGFSAKWTIPEAYPNGPAEFVIYILTVVTLVLGFMLLVLGYTQFYEDVFCGELQMCRKFLHCCCPCWCPKAVTLEELLAAGRERPPSLPV